MDTYKIGIGLSTYNRPDEALSIARAIRDTTENTNLICSIDGGSFLNYDLGAISSTCDDIIIGSNQGVCRNKNRLLVYLQNCDFIFLIEDDLRPLKKGWVEMYIEALNKSGYQHFNYIHTLARSLKISEKEVSDKITFEYYEDLGGALMIVTKECLNKVGILDPDYKFYGYGHCDYTRRCRLAGIYPSVEEGNPHIKGIDEYITLDYSIPQTTSALKRTEDRANNETLYRRGSPNVLVTPNQHLKDYYI
jgi:GT2 family glycosyltransferase